MVALSGLPRRLVEQNIISAEQAQEIFKKAKEERTHFVGGGVGERECPYVSANGV